LSTEQHIYITDIYIKELRHLKDITIPITTPEKGLKHLILTGKNGSGKTSLLERVRDYLHLTHTVADSFELKKMLDRTDIEIAFSRHHHSITLHAQRMNEVWPDTPVSKFILSYFDAKRNYKPDRPSSIEKFDTYKLGISDDNSKSFLKYLVFFRSVLTDASYTDDKETVDKLEKWFARFETILRKIFNDDKLTVQYESRGLNFVIHQSNRKPFDFRTLSDGYAAVLQIISELIIRMGEDYDIASDTSGIVLIDEVEAHLHIELQKQILPFLTGLFPNIQFIVSTHSPFILNSIENAVVYDLENHILFEDASELSVSGLVKGFFQQTSEYSASMERRINELEALHKKTDKTEADQQRLADLINDLKTLSPLLSPEMYLRFSIVQQSFYEKVPINA
jgi:predicted ATPase